MTTAPEAANTAEAIEPPPAAAPDETETSLTDAAQAWLTSLRVAFARAVDITVLEARLAALNFVLIVIIGVASGLLLATAWIALFAAIVAGLHELGLSWSLALLLIATVNLLLAVAGGFAIYRMSNNLLFRAIRKFIMYGESDVRAESAAGNTPPAP